MRRNHNCRPARRRLRDRVEDLLQILGRASATALDELLRYVASFALPGMRQKYPSTRQRLGQAARQVRLRDPLGYLSTAAGRWPTESRLSHDTWSKTRFHSMRNEWFVKEPVPRHRVTA